jgi:hypothetical protein
MICLNSMHNNSLFLSERANITWRVGRVNKKGINNRKLYLPTSECTLRQGRIEFPFGNSKWRLFLCKSTSSYLIFTFLSLWCIYARHILCVDANNGQLREREQQAEEENWEKKGIKFNFFISFSGMFVKRIRDIFLNLIHQFEEWELKLQIILYKNSTGGGEIGNATDVNLRFTLRRSRNLSPHKCFIWGHFCGCNNFILLSYSCQLLHCVLSSSIFSRLLCKHSFVLVCDVPKEFYDENVYLINKSCSWQ